MQKKDMTIMEIVANLGTLYTALTVNSDFQKAAVESPLIMDKLIAIKRAIQILVSLDLKNEMESSYDE